MAKSVMASRIHLKEDGTILLGEHVSCDGFAYGRPVRVQTHIHSDHMVGFNTSKANQTIIMSKPTKDLLNALYNADLQYRSNICSIGVGSCHTVNNELIELLPSHHMLGSMQVAVTCVDKHRVGYSSDFFWPVDKVIEVDELIVDSTYGDPSRVRNYIPSQVDDKVASIVAASLRAGKSTALISYHGRIEYALYMLSNFVTKYPLICSPKVASLAAVYNENGYAMPKVIPSDSDEGISLLRRHELCLAFISMPERRHLPWIDRFAKITLSAYMTRPDDPVLCYGNGDYSIAFTDHADFEGTLEYIKRTGANFVWTDPRTGNAEALAHAIKRHLGINSQIAPRIKSKSWG
ncbi:hypothetical protein ACFL0M_11390 [Thermodesulfobacteriota bacterium]